MNRITVATDHAVKGNIVETACTFAHLVVHLCLVQVGLLGLFRFLGLAALCYHFLVLAGDIGIMFCYSAYQFFVQPSSLRRVIL